MKIARFDTYIENVYMDKLDNNITHEEWKRKDTKWRTGRDKLYIRLKEIDKINEKFKDKSNTILDFCEDAHSFGYSIFTKLYALAANTIIKARINIYLIHYRR